MTPSPDDIREAAMVVYHRWRAFLPHEKARLKALVFAVRCRRLSYVLSVEAVLPADAGLTPREITASLPDVPRSAVNEALLILVRSGRASFEGESGRRRYRLSEEA